MICLSDKALLPYLLHFLEYEVRDVYNATVRVRKMDSVIPPMAASHQPTLAAKWGKIRTYEYVHVL